MVIPSLGVGDTLILKKAHPCGSCKFRILRIGSDIRIKCEGCGRDLEIEREKLEKRIRSLEKT